MAHRVVAEELELLERVSTVLDRPPPAARPSEEPLVRELEGLREQLLAHGDGKDAGALRQQFDRESALLRQLRSAGDAPRVDPRSPYFAHLRLREGDVERDLCLGRATCIEGDVRIVDWRNAPISRLFYRYEQGEEYEEELAGRTRTGRVVARRSVGIHDGVLRRVEAPEGVFVADPQEDAGWRRETRRTPRLRGGEASATRFRTRRGEAIAPLAARAAAPRGAIFDKHLPEITSLLDREQFELIARPSSGFLVIRGAAGSGKTTVALHRIAYLAYADPDVDSANTLFVTLSPALRRYVGHVLPALGVERVRILTFGEWAGAARRRHFPELPGEPRADTPAAVQRLKLHPALARVLAEQVRSVAGAPTREQALDDWASALTNRPLLEEVFGRDAPGEVSGAELGRFADEARRRNEELFAWLAREPEVEARLDPEDDALLLRAWQLRVGPLRGRGGRPLRYRHVAIDEVQDFAPLEVRVLIDCLDGRRSLTLAGDTQQHVLPHTGFTSWSAFLSQLGVRGAEIETLRVSYRSTREIVDFAEGLLGELQEEDEAPAATRSGPPVELFGFTDRGACVAFLADALKRLALEEPLASVAVLTPSPEASALYHRGLDAGDVPGLRRVERQDFTFAPGVEVTEIEQVKGLEFDYVVLVDVTAANFPDAPLARRLLHVGATRAVHQLWLTAVGTPSPALRALETR